MLVLGRKHKFTEAELLKLHKKFKNINITRYTNRKEEDVLKELEEAINSQDYSILVLNTKAKVGDDIIKYLINLQFLEHNKSLKVVGIEHFMEKYLQKCYIPDDHTNLDFLESIKPFNKFQYFQKRVVDYIGCFTLLLITWPVILYARKRIKRESPGTSMFKQFRVGYRNQEFKCNKFRSMNLDAEKDGAKFACKNDPRVFQWGDMMRKTRIDELPQVLNVLKGEMHFIGPRPERKVWTEKFEKSIPYYNERHLVRPGITGWAQVMYPYGENTEDAKQKLMYDLYYIKHWNILLELKIVYKTIMVVLGRKGM